MKITNDKVARFHYSLSEVGGDTLESSTDGEALSYLHGHNNILYALESELEGKEVGDEFSVTVAPEQAYGMRDENKTQRVPIKHLLNKGKIRPGMLVKINGEKGAIDARVLKVGRFNVDVDLNHPFAGKTLVFNIKVLEVRDAEPSEIAHGHAHGVGGHHH